MALTGNVAVFKCGLWYCGSDASDVYHTFRFGGSVVWVGALWSFWRSRRIYNLLIAGEVMIAGLAGTLASQGLGTIAFPLANIVALLLIFWGYVKARDRSSHGQSQEIVHETPLRLLKSPNGNYRFK